MTQVLAILMRLSGISRGSFFLSKLWPVLTVPSGILCIAREVAALITQLAMISRKIRLTLRYLAPWVSGFRGALTKFRLGEDGLG